MGSTVIAAPLAYASVLSNRVGRWLTYSTVFVADMLAFIAAGTGAVIIRYLFHAQFTPADWIRFTPAMLVLFAVFSLSGLYPGIACSPTDEFRVILRASTISFFFLIGLSFFLREGLFLSRIVIGLAWLLTIFLVPICRRVLRGVCSRQPWWGIATVILGERETGVMMFNLLKGHRRLGLRPIALLLDPTGPEWVDSNSWPGNVLIGDLSDAHSLGVANPGCYAVIAMPNSGADRVRMVVTRHVRTFSNVLIIPDLFGIRSLAVAAKDICGVLTLKIEQRLTHFFPRWCKRTVDLLAALFGLVLFSPLLLVIAIAVRLDSGGPIFYGQRRIGRNAKPFTVWKFRSMLVDADAVLRSCLEANPDLQEEWNRDHKLKCDPRVTPVGRVIRKFSLDELPQLWNVLCGEMSLVGPRPIVEAEIGKYGDSFDQYQLVTPGVTGLWQVSGRNSTTYELRTRIDDYYVRNWSLSLDLYILLRTFKTLLLSEGAY